MSISVIVLTYNEEATIGRTLDSILAQECSRPYEIVIGEDCSTDGTRAVCERYAARFPDKIRLMPKTKNKGIIDNYYDCLAACRGEYIADCAGDDFWTDCHKLEKEARILDDNPEVTLVHTDWRYYNELTGETSMPPENKFGAAFTDGKTMLEAIVTQTERPVIHLCTAMYRASILRKAYAEDPLMFRNNDFGCEDLQVCFLMAYTGKIAWLPDVTLHYSSGGETVSFSADDVKQFRFVRKVTDLSRYICKKYGLRSDNIDAYFAQRAHALTMHTFRSGNKKLRNEAKECARRWQAKRKWLTKMVDAVMSNALTWRIALSARNAVVEKLKR